MLILLVSCFFCISKSRNTKKKIIKTDIPNSECYVQILKKEINYHYINYHSKEWMICSCTQHIKQLLKNHLLINKLTSHTVIDIFMCSTFKISIKII